MSTIEQDVESTPVIFRKDRGGPFKGVVTAIFPTQPGTYRLNDYICYQHIGQHGTCDLGWYQKTRKASPEEYAELAKELESQGYRLKIYQKFNRKLICEYRKQMNALQ